MPLTSIDSIHFEEISEKYLSKVLALYNYYVKETICTFHAKPLTLEQFRELVFFENPKYKTFILLEKEELCGYVLLSQYKKREAYNDTAEVTIYLKPDSIGKGLGTLALQHIERFARSVRMHVLVATICGENEKSIKVFEKNGYSQCAHYREIGRKFGQLLDVVAYQKILQ